MKNIQALLSNTIKRPDITKSRKVQTAFTGLLVAVIIYLIPELEENANELVLMIGIFGAFIIKAFGDEDKAAASVAGSRAPKYDSTALPKVIINNS